MVSRQETWLGLQQGVGTVWQTGVHLIGQRIGNFPQPQQGHGAGEGTMNCNDGHRGELSPCSFLCCASLES